MVPPLGGFTWNVP
jgi:hypothetical protein